MGIKWKNSEINKKNIIKGGSYKGILLILLCAAIAATAMCCAYPLFRNRATEHIQMYINEVQNEKQKEVMYR